jgi:uncharacterized protein YndB with AHSA1/START domain
VEQAISRTIELPRPPPAVWSAITSSRELAAWFGAHAEVDLRDGGAVRFRWIDGSERRGIVEVVDAPRRFAFRWREVIRVGSAFRVGEVSRVEFRLKPSASGGTLLTVTEAPGVTPADAIARSATPVQGRPSNAPRLLAAR